jgi:anti-sigma factor RsiW
MLSETDQELLEAYLDDALASDEVEAVARRLAQEPELATALDSARADRRQRGVLWAALEPSEANANAFAQSTLRAIRRRRIMVRVAWASRFGGAAAACLLMGLGGGWYMRGRGAPVSNSAVTNPADGAQQVHFVESPNADLPPGAYQVALTDQNGNVLTVQKFNKLEEAQHFAQDLGQVVERQQDVQNGRAMLVSDHF